MGSTSPRAGLALPSANPRLPADHGLPALGMVCHATLNLATIILTMLWLGNIATLARADDRLPAIGILIIGFVRANFHRLAADAMLDRSPSVFRLVRRYGVAALASTAAMALIIHLLDDKLPLPFYLAFVVLSLYWPVTLFFLTSRRDLRRTFEAADTFDLPLVPADRSLEGVGVLMIAFSSLGLGALLVASVELFPFLDDSEALTSVLIAALLLGARGIYHFVAGVSTLAAPSPDAFARFAGRYLLVALLTVFASVIALFLVSGARFSVELLALMILMGYLLIFWPLHLKRFALRLEVDPDDLRRVEHIAGPAPDRGLTALGYLLVSLGVTSVALKVSTFVGAIGLSGLFPVAIADLSLADLFEAVHAALAVFAGLALVGMMKNRHLAVYTYIAAAVGALVVDLLLKAPSPSADMSEVYSLIDVIAVTVHLVPPILVAVLIRRRLPPAPEVTPARGTPAMNAPE